MEEEIIELAPVAASLNGKVTPQPPLGEELGVYGPLPFSGGYNSAELLNVQDITIDELVMMRKLDGQVRALLRVLTLPIRATGYTIEPGEDGAEQEAEYFKLMFSLPPQQGGMSISLKRFVKQILIALIEGFAAFEEVYQIPTTGPLAGKVTLRKMAYRQANTVRFIVDSKGGFNGLHQQTSFQGRSVDVKIPKEKCWYYAANEEENPFYGE